MSDTGENIVKDYPKTHGPGLFKHEDYWAIWLGAFLLLVGLAIFLPNEPKDMRGIIEASNATIQAEEARAPFRTLAWHEANDKKERLRGRDVGFAKTVGAYLETPKRWSGNPAEAFVLGEEEAKAKAAAAKEKHDKSKEKLAAAHAKAKEAEAAAASAEFKDAAANDAARAAIGDWRKAREAESKARSAAGAKPYNIVGSLIVLCVCLGLMFSVGAAFMGWSVPKFLLGFPVVFALATLAYLLAAQADIRGWGLEYVLWAILLGLIISNTVGTPA